MKQFVLFLIVMSILFCDNTVFAQKNLELILFNKSKEVIFKSKYQDSLLLKESFNKQIQDFILNGYFSVRVIDSVWQKNTFSAVIELGEKFDGLRLSNGNIEEEKLKVLIGKIDNLSINNLKQTFKSIINYYENNGFPFAEVGLDSFKFENNIVKAKIFVTKNPPILIDSIIVVGNANLSTKFLRNFLDLKYQTLYSEQKISEIDKQLKKLNFIEIVKPSEIVFTGEKSRINLFINKKNANQFDGIIGFQPSNNNSKIQFTGDFKLRLHNSFKKAEVLNFNYKGLPNQSQNLLSNISLPYLLFSRIGIDFDFQFFKRDSSFLNTNLKLDFVFPLSKNKTISLSYESFNGNLIAQSVDNKISNIKTNYYGLGANFQNLDDFYFPQKGHRLKFMLSIGQRNTQNTGIIKNENSSIQLKSVLNNQLYFKFSPRFNLYLNQQGAYLSGKSLFENEIYRIGGFNNLRGFLEQSIITNSYIINTTEFRYLIEKKSYIFLFQDQSLININPLANDVANFPYGFGFGINFENKLGMLGINYAIGKQQNIPINLQKGNIHFGLISNF